MGPCQRARSGRVMRRNVSEMRSPTAPARLGMLCIHCAWAEDMPGLVKRAAIPGQRQPGTTHPPTAQCPPAAPTCSCTGPDITSSAPPPRRKR